MISLVALVLVACAHGQPTEPQASEVDNGVVVSVLEEGREGMSAADGKRVWFHYEVFDAKTGERLRSEGLPERLTTRKIGEPAGNPFDGVLQQVLRDRKPGYRARVHVPAAVLDAGKPERAPASADVWLTLAIEHVDQPKPVPPRLGTEAYAESIDSWTLPGGSRLDEYARGDGRSASEGDVVEAYMTMTVDSRKIGFPDGPTLFWMRDDDPFLLGAKPGSLRTITTGQLVTYLQVIDVVPQQP